MNQSRTLIVLVLSAVCLAAASRVDTSLDQALFDAIRQGNVPAVKRLVQQGANVNAKDGQGTPAIMQAALYSTAACMQVLLEHGADPNARNAAAATALIWAAGDAGKVKLLLAKHADVNARSGPGRTALLAAASQDGAYQIVDALLRAGADINAKDNLNGPPPVPTGGGGALASIEAAKARDSRTLRLLLARGMPVNAMDHNGNTALSEAVLYGNRDNAMLLLDQGADVNTKIGPFEYTPLMFAAMRNDAAIARALLQHGAQINIQSKNGDSPLMWAAYTDTRDPAIVKLFLEAGADVNHRNKYGESALIWANRRGETEVTRALRQAGATDAPAGSGTVTSSTRDSNQSLREAVESSFSAMQPSGPQFVKKSGCISCHHQTLPAMATALAHQRGFRFDEQTAQRELKSVLGFISPAREILLEGTDVLPDIPVTAGNILLALHAQGYAPDALTDSIVHNIAGKQLQDGSWIGWAPRPPLESGDIQATALALRSLQLYPIPGRKQEFESRIARARSWLLHSMPHTTEEQRMRLLGLTWSGAGQREIRRAADALLGSQRSDGGWAQLPTLESDAYATGSVLAALAESSQLPVTDAAYRRGTAYLLRTQQPNGTWLVRTRAYPFQPLVDTGFAHGRDQWISISGTTWASIALMLSAGSN